MAIILGVTLKAVKTGIGYDRQANIYLHNRMIGDIYLHKKKIGDIWDDGYLDITIVKSREEFEVACKKYQETHNEFFNPDENLIYALLDLHDTEKQYKKAIKQGYKAVANFDYKPRDEKGNIDYTKPFPYPFEETFWLPKPEDVNVVLDQKKPVKHSIFQSLDDFIIE